MLLLGLLAVILPGLLSTCRRSQIRLGERDQEFKFTYDGRERDYILHRPPGSATRERALVLVMHGGGGTARGVIEITRGRFSELADAHDFLVVYPNGIDNGWNDGRVDVRATAHREKIDDESI